jgi:acyl-CoA synthetase (AMP-forming)/AMP-acid ligase II
MYLTQFVHRALQQYPERTAVRVAGRERSFRELADRIARLAAVLRGIGLKDGDRVAMLSLSSDRQLEYQMAVPWAGGVLNPCNTRWSEAELLYALDDSESTVLLVDETFAALGATLCAKARTLREVIYCGVGALPPGMHDYEALLARASPLADQVRRGDDLAGIFYTGGTTGFPKGVMLSHTNLCSSALAILSEGLFTQGTYLHAAPMFHLADFGQTVVQWAAGNSHAIIPGFDPAAVLDAIERERVTHTLLVPTMIQMLIDHPSFDGSRDVSSLRTIMYGASPMPERLLERAMAAFPGVDFVQAYGMTELAPLATVCPALYQRPENRHLGKRGSVGRAAVCIELRIVDGEDGELPRGEVGEIAARGPNVMRGYWNKPQATAEALRNGWMHTGDLGYMDADGFVFLVDRAKDMIISGGENVYSAEVENALVQHEAVAACAVIGVPNEQWGESVHACIVCRPGMQVSAEELGAHCRRLIAGYKCPRSIDFVDSLPLSGPGKVLKAKLRERYRG